MRERGARAMSILGFPLPRNAAAVNCAMTILKSFYRAVVAMGHLEPGRNPLAHFPKLKAAPVKLPVFLGEFGAYRRADLSSRARWTNAVARAAESHAFSWAYWEFCSGFGVFDPQQGAWIGPLRKALLP